MTSKRKPFPVGGAEVAELAEPKARIAAEQMPRMLELSQFLDAHGSTCGIDTLLQIARKSWDGVVLYWAGLPPAEQRRFEDACVPWWDQCRGLEEQVATKAKRMIQRRKEREANGAG